MQKAVFDESLAEQNPLARQVSSGSRGSPLNLASLRGSDLLYTDHRDRVLPIPVLDGGHILFLILEKLKGTPGISGTHIMAVHWESIIPRLVGETGLNQAVPALQT